MMSVQKRSLVRLVMAVSLVALLFGMASCSGENAEEMFQKGIDATTADNLDDAVIWFKKALQKNPEMAITHFKLGEIYRKKGNPKLAFAELNMAVQQDPTLKDARKELAFLLVENRALKQAVEVCEQYLEVNGDDEEIYLILASSLAFQKKHDEAIDVLKKGLVSYPDNVLIETNLAKLEIIKGKTKEGRAMLEKLVTKKPDDIMRQINLAQAYEGMERYDLAVMTLEKSKEAFPDKPLPYISLVQLSLKKNQPDKAKALIIEAEKKGINDSRLYNLYAMISHRQGNTKDAFTYFEKSVDASTDEARTANQMILADYYTFNKKYKEAQGILEKIIAEDDSNKKLKSKVVELFMAQGDFEQARTSVDSLLKDDSGNARGHFLKGLMMMQNKDVAEARKEFSKAKELAPNAAENQFMYGMTFVNESEQISITEISEALKKNPNLPRARLALAELHAKKGNFQESLDELDKILAKQTDSSKPGNLSVRVMRIAVLMKMKDFDSALKDAKVLVDLQPENPGHVARLAEIYFSLKKFDKALPLYETLLKKKPGNVKLLNRIVGILMLTKKSDNAMEVTNIFLAKYPENAAAITVKAKIYLAQGYTDLAKNVLIPEVEKGKEVAPIAMLAELYKNENDDDNAVKYYKKALELAPGNVGVTMKLADIYLKNGKKALAIDSYEDVLKKKDDFLPAMNNLAFLYSEDNKNLDRALKLASAATRQLPGNPDVADTLGWIYVLKNAYSQAEPYLEQAINTKPNNPIIIYHMAILRKGQKEFLESEKLLQKAIKNGLAGKELGLANEILATMTETKDKLAAAKAAKDRGDAEKAIVMFEKIKQSEGLDPEAAAHLGVLYAEQNKDITVALDLVQKAYDAQSGSPLIADALGWVYYHQGSLLMAKQYMEKAIENDAKYGPAYVHLGAVYLKKNESEAAKKILSKAQKMKLSPVDKKRLKELQLKLGN